MFGANIEDSSLNWIGLLSLIHPEPGWTAEEQVRTVGEWLSVSQISVY